MSGEDEITMAGAQFTVVDYVVFSLMLVVSVGIGVWSAYKSHGKESTHDFLLGSRSMSPFPVALSLLGGIISAISILGNPTEVYLYGTQLCVSLMGMIFGCLMVQQIPLPVFYNLRLVSINQYLELRFKSRTVHILGTVCQLIVKFFYMGVCLYAPSLALSTVTSLSIWGSVVLMGLVCTFYISVGGVKAVVYTDVLQTLLMFGGVLLVVIFCCKEIGPANVWNIADQGGRIEFFNFNTSPFERYTFWSTNVFGFYLVVNVIGINQPSYQRFASVSTLTTAKWLCLSFLVGIWVLWVLFFFSGLVAYAEYSHCDPLTSGRIHKADQIIPYLVMEKLGHLPGIPGVFVAAVYGGVLSSLSSNGNAIACMIWEDFLKDRPYFAKMSNSSATRVLKVLSMVAGVSGIFLGMVAGQLGNIFHVISSFSSSIMGPLQGVFLAGMCTPWVNTKGALSGFLIALCYNFWVVVGKFLRGGGHPPHLPLSVDGCPENLLHLANTSTAGFVSNTTTIVPGISLTADLTTDFATTQEPYTNRDEGGTVYDVSYCYFGTTGIVMTFVISNIVSLLTSPLSPKDVDEHLCWPSGVRLHRWLWKTCCGPRDITTKTEGEADQAPTMGMLTNTNKQLIGGSQIYTRPNNAQHDTYNINE